MYGTREFFRDLKTLLDKRDPELLQEVTFVLVILYTTLEVAPD